MRREIFRTSDGSTSIYLPDWDENYHSKHGAVQEARHVFIQNGLDLFQGKATSVLEIGFGTGLNAFITFLEAEAKKQSISYTGVEAFPVAAHEVALMNYPASLGAEEQQAKYVLMHEIPWEIPAKIGDYFTLLKRCQKFETIEDEAFYDLIYFDAFGFRVQPELWSEDLFKRMFRALKPGGILVTYAARSVIKRNMQSAGFVVTKHLGPPGKREMFRAVKE